MNKETYKLMQVFELPVCEFCVNGTKATFDGYTNLPESPRRLMCSMHFVKYGIGLGLGRGQRLVLVKSKFKQVNLREFNLMFKRIMDLDSHRINQLAKWLSTQLKNNDFAAEKFLIDLAIQIDLIKGEISRI